MPPEIEIASRPDAGPLPRKMGKYTLLRPLGSASTCEAFLALTGAPGFDRTCVVKRILADHVHDAPYVERFLREGRALLDTSHGSLAQVLDVARAEDGVPFLVMEYVEGKDLAGTIDGAVAKGRRLAPEIAMHVAVSILDGLHHAWTRRDTEGARLRLMHGDLSLQSVVLSYEGQVKLVDLGMARAQLAKRQRARGVLRGTPAHLAPEQVASGEVDVRTDVFAVGVLLWELLASKRLLPGDFSDHLEQLRQGRFRPPPLAGRVPRVHADLDRIVARATAPDPGARHRDASALHGEIAEVLHRIAPGSGAAELARFLEQLFAGEREHERAELSALLDVGRAQADRTASYVVPAAPRAASTGPAAPLASPGPDHVPGTRYRILGKIGEGGMGTVYDAVHADLERRVALKILHAEASTNPEFVERFRQEARAVARLGHDNIVAATDFGQTADGRVFFAMERLEGESLADRLFHEGALETAESLRIAEQVLRGLGAAHGIGLVHRDIKPENVFLTEEGTVKLLDFGIAKAMGDHTVGPKLTREGIAIGTPEYMAPEQAAAGTVDARTDLYGVGVVLYEMLTGSLPFQAEAVPKLLVKHMEEPPERPSLRAPARAIPEEIERIVMRALEKDPEARFETARDMAAEVLAAMRSLRTPLEVPAARRPTPEVEAEPRVQWTRPDTPTAVAEAARRASQDPRAARRLGIRIPLVAAIGLLCAAVAYFVLRSAEEEGPVRTAGPAVATLATPQPQAPHPASAEPPEPKTAISTATAGPEAAPETAEVPQPATAAAESFRDLLARADEAYDSRRYEEAERLVEKAAKRSPNSSAWRIRLARIAHRQGDDRTARRHLDIILGRDENNAAALRLLERINR